jgi:hypothetical protein
MTMPTWTSSSQAQYVQVGAVSVIAYGGRRNGQADADVVYALQLGKVLVRDKASMPNGRTTKNAPWGLSCLALSLNQLDYYEALWSCSGRVYLTTDFAQTFTQIDDTLRKVVQFQEGLKAIALVIVNLVDGARAYVVGTERGVFVSFSFAPTVWQRLGTEAEFPNVVIFGTMRWDPVADILLIPTLGRGVWGLYKASSVLQAMSMGNPCPVPFSFNVAARAVVWPQNVQVRSWPPPPSPPPVPASSLSTAAIIAIIVAVILIVSIGAACVYRHHWQTSSASHTSDHTLNDAALSEIDPGYAKLSGGSLLGHFSNPYIL